jgi:hypothetical protein
MIREHHKIRAYRGAAADLIDPLRPLPVLRW